MKQKIINILMLMPALLFMACSSDDVAQEKGGATEGTPIKIMPVVSAPQTRTDFGLATSIGDGEIVNVWVDNADNNSILYSSYHYKAQSYQNIGDATRTHVLTYDGSQTTPLFPTFDTKLNLYALHWSGSMDENTTLYMGSSLTTTHTTQPSQVYQTDYAKSDLLWGKKIGQATSSSVAMPFYHMLSNIVVKFPSDQDLNLLNKITKITIKNVCRTATVTLTRDTVRLSNETDRGSIEIAHDFGTGRLNEGIIIPQSVTFGEFLELTTSDGRTFVYEAGNMRFEPGHQYTFNITVNTDGFVINSPQITDWVGRPANNADATATMPDESGS